MKFSYYLNDMRYVMKLFIILVMLVSFVSGSLLLEGITGRRLTRDKRTAEPICSCNETFCECCSLVTEIDINVCAEIYLDKENSAIVIRARIDEKVIFEQSFAIPDIPPLCLPVPIPLPVPIIITICTEITDIGITPEAGISGCVKISATVYGIGLTLDFDCFVIPTPIGKIIGLPDPNEPAKKT